MYQYFKSALLVASLAIPSVFQSASAAVHHAPLPYVHELTVSPQGFSVDLSRSESDETVRFFIQNFSGKRLRCTLKGPDGDNLETVYIKANIRETKRNYLFNSADEGVYTLEVSNGKDRIVKKITLHRTASIVSTELNIQ